jgi:MtrB/PioB family decaheme-associated outer membrane protein
MNPTSYSTDTINTALNWVGDKAHLTAGYFGSIFHDDYNSLSWQSGIVSGATGCVGTGCFVNNTMSTAPSNSLHQANLSGGYNFTPTTKLTGGFSYGYNTQNSSYAPTLIPQNNGTSFNMMQTNGLPVTSLNGVVQTTHGDLKITNQSIKDLTLNAGFKFNERDNQTDSNTYLYKNIGSTGVGTNGFYTGVNTPYSNRKVQYEASADYRLTKAQNLNLAYEHETVDRWCNKVVGGAQCVSSPNTEEDKIALTYRLKAIENINFNTGYSYANRRADFAHFLANTGSYGTGSSIDSGNVLGYIAYPFASRDQHLGKAGVNWQVTPKVDVGVNGRYSQDNYDVTYGLKNGKSASVNIDATYSYADNGSVSVYWSWQNSRRYLHRGANGSVTVPPTQIYNNKLDDNSHAVGLLAKQGGLLNGKLEITGDMSYSFDASAYSSQLFYTPTNGIPCNDPRALTCGDLTPIKNELISLKLTGNYKIHKNGKVALAYMYQKLNSNDYFYNGQQFGFTQSSLMPTGLQLQDYTVNAVALSYNLAF